MYRIILGILITLCSVSKSISSDNYRIGDQLFVWAKSGLSVRSGPGTGYPNIKSISFGEKVLVVDTCIETFNLTLISETDPNSNNHGKIYPIILRGNWVKISVGPNLIGFVIDHYLLGMDPKNMQNQGHLDFMFKVLKIDTTYKSPIQDNGNETDYCILAHHDLNITTSHCYGGLESAVSYSFPGFTIEEVLILFSSSERNYENFYIIRNWKDEIFLSDGVICQWRITYKNNTTFLLVECSC